MATVIITGGGGFLGQCLASALLEKGSLRGANGDDVPIKSMILADIFFPPTLQPTIEQHIKISSNVTKCQGDVSNVEFCNSLYDQIPKDDTTTHVSVFHLGAVMSGDGERDFDLCLRVNLYGFLNMIDGARRQVYDKLGFPATFVFASAGATIGSGSPTDYVQKDDTISDASRATPHTTYGATKACCELLLTDYARRGFVDGRGVRLPTIVVRAGAPNAATTSCFSGVIREPLSGIDVELPIAAHVKHAVTGKRAAIHAMLTIHNAPKEDIESILGFDRTVFLPAVALSLGELEGALHNVVTPESVSKLGKITYNVNEFLSGVVGGFPTKIDAERAFRLGVPPAPDAETLVREYAADFPSALVEGVELVQPAPHSTPPMDVARSDGSKVAALGPDQKVAVITGGGSGIGRAVSERLAKGGWALVLAGRRPQTLEETKAILPEGSKCICVKADVSKEDDVQALFDAAEAQFGQVDLLFNNAGINCGASSVENVSLTDFERVLQTNLTGPFLCAKAAMKCMAKGGRGGRIINNGSISAHVPRPGSAPYTASKHAMWGLTKCIALDGRALNVACGQIDFGNVVSDLSLATNTASGAAQANGTMMVEPNMSLHDAAETFWAMANLPLEANVLQMTVMATKMPFVGRG